MSRIIIKGNYMNPAGECDHDMKTFVVDLPEVERYLSETFGFGGSRQIIGAEITDDKKGEIKNAKKETTYDEKI